MLNPSRTRFFLCRSCSKLRGNLVVFGCRSYSVAVAWSDFSSLSRSFLWLASPNQKSQPHDQANPNPGTSFAGSFKPHQEGFKDCTQGINEGDSFSNSPKKGHAGSENLNRNSTLGSGRWPKVFHEQDKSRDFGLMCCLPGPA